MEKNVIAVVVSWNLREKVLRCLESIHSQDVVSGTILVDNGSSDETPNAVREKFPDIEIIELGRNTGFAAAANTGLRRAASIGAEFALLVNSDVVSPSGAVAALVNAAVEERAGAVGAKLVRMDDASRLDGAYGVINWRNFISRIAGENEQDGEMFSRRKKVDYALGAFLLLRMKALDKVGLFDESYFAYHEEMELCERLRRGGYPVIFEPTAVKHEAGGSVRAAGANLAREYLLARNSVRFAVKYGGVWMKLKFWLFVIAASALKFPKAIIDGKLQEHLANVRGWQHGFSGRPFDDKLKREYKLL